MSKRDNKLDDVKEEIEANKKLKTVEENKNEIIPYTSKYADLPHEILIAIFSFLNLKDQCQCARVCKSWRRAAYDNFLWFQVDLSDSSVNLKNLWKLIRHKCFPNVESIKLCGNLKNINAKQNLPTLSKALMQKLNETCSKLIEIEIEYADLNSINVNDLRKQMEKLSFIRCEIPLKWFQPSSVNDKFANLSHLDFTGSSRICKAHLEDLNKICVNVKFLSLKKCYRIDDKALDCLVKLDIFLNSLEVLNLDETSVSQEGVNIVIQQVKSLKIIYVKSCKCIVGDLKMNLENNELKIVI